MSVDKHGHQRLSPEVSSSLKEGLANLENVDGLDVLNGPYWDKDIRQWILFCRFTVKPGSVWPLPAQTNWYIHIAPVYPAGKIKIYPAKKGGVQETFPHQSLNLEEGSKLWRTGNICVEVYADRRRTSIAGAEPMEASLRLRWYAERSIEWISAASHGELRQEGDPFELPDFGAANEHVVGFSEDSESFEIWEKELAQTGVVQLFSPSNNSVEVKLTSVQAYLSLDRQQIYKPNWGIHFTGKSNEIELGLWVKLVDVPYIKPWKPPTTWQELLYLTTEAGVDLQDLIYSQSRYLRKQKSSILLLGFPIPSTIGDKPVQFFWQAMEIPKLCAPNAKKRGFRSNEGSTRKYEGLQVFRKSKKIHWIRSENWNTSTRSLRGSFQPSLTDRTVCLIGCGALGSVIAELLVRGGGRSVMLCDNDLTLTGNLVRHTLTLNDISERKADAISSRLNLASMHSNIEIVDGIFPPDKPALIRKIRNSNMVIDCTGDNTVINALESFEWRKDAILCSFSLDWEAHKLFSYVADASDFSANYFFEKVRPFLISEGSNSEVSRLIQEGLGCWHPVMPARIDKVWTFASIAISYLEEVILNSPIGGRFAIFERDESNGFMGIKRLE